MALPSRPKSKLRENPSTETSAPARNLLPMPGTTADESEEVIVEDAEDYTNDFQQDDDYDVNPDTTWDTNDDNRGGAIVADNDDEDNNDTPGEPEGLDQELAGLSDDIVDSVERLMAEILSDESSEVIMNGPASVHYKKNGQRFHVPEINFKDIKTYHHIINRFVLEYTDTKERISENSYLIEGQLQIEDIDDPSNPPTVARVHIVAPPAVRQAQVTIAKKAKRQFTLEDLLGRDTMSEQQYEFIKAIARGKVTTVISGLSGSGKTTLLEAMSHYFDQNDRVVVVEDTPELTFPISDVVYMVSSKPKPGEDKSKTITLEWLVQQTNRMRPDRIVVGETRGAEMSEFLLAANSGADGSMTTIHAQDPRRALAKMSNLASRSADSQSEIAINKDIASTVQIIIQTGLIDGRHVITHIEEISNIIRKDTGAISTTPLFEYDRNADVQVPKGRPSDALKNFMAARNVHVDLGWFQEQR